MRWKKTRPISALQKELEAGEWSYSYDFVLCDAAKEWGCNPSDFGLCSPQDDPAVKLAFTRTVATMRAWERHEEKRAREQQKNRRGGPGRKGRR